MQKLLDEVTRTERGFELIRFSDHHGFHCSLQQSSLALSDTPGTSAIWLGMRDERMHLTYDQVNSLVSRLQNWLDTGSFITGDD